MFLDIETQNVWTEQEKKKIECFPALCTQWLSSSHSPFQILSLSFVYLVDRPMQLNEGKFAVNGRWVSVSIYFSSLFFFVAFE